MGYKMAFKVKIRKFYNKRKAAVQIVTAQPNSVQPTMVSTPLVPLIQSSKSPKIPIKTPKMHEIPKVLIKTPKIHKSPRPESIEPKNSTNSTAQQEILNKIYHYLLEFKGSQSPEHIFIGKNIPQITFSNYVNRLAKFTNSYAEELESAESIAVLCGLSAIIYIRRLDIKINSYSIHRCYAMCYYIAFKFLYDYAVVNRYLANVVGCTIQEFNKMEACMCQKLEWKMNISPEEYNHLSSIIN